MRDPAGEGVRNENVCLDDQFSADLLDVIHGEKKESRRPWG